jgi:NADPH:quinone reductase-like Zn-dependent oxidoreductase
VDVVVEVAGGASLGRSIRACGYGGRVAVIGVLDGSDSPVNVRDFLSRQVTVRGIFMESTQELRALAKAVEVNRIEPWIDRVFAFGQAREAYEHLRNQRHIGKVVIRVGSGS